MEPEKIYIQNVDAMHLPKRRSKGYWYDDSDSTIRNYITGKDNASFSGIGLRSLQRARNDYMSLGDTFRRKSLSAPEMARLDNEYGIDQSLFDIARSQVESNYQNAEENYNSGKISDRKWNRLSKKYDRELSNLNENYTTLDQHQNPLKYVSGNGDITPLLFSIGLPTVIIGGIEIAPHLWSALSHPIVQGIGAIDGIRNLFTGNGVQKTINHFKDEKYGEGMLSLAGDVLDASPLLGMPKTSFYSKNWNSNLYPYGKMFSIEGNKNIEKEAQKYYDLRNLGTEALIRKVSLNNVEGYEYDPLLNSWSRVQYTVNPNTSKLQTDLQFWKEYAKLKKSDEILKHRLSNDDNLNKLYKELEESFKDPYLKQMVGKNPQYYAPMRYYMDVMRLDEISAWKQLITDRNTMYRTTAYAGNNADEVATNVKNNLHKYTFEITENPNNKYNPSVVDFVRTEPNIGILYSGEGARAYMSPLWVLRRARGQGQNTDAVFKYGDLPTNVTGVTTKSSPKLDFSGSHHEWYKRNLTLPKSSQSINGNFSYNGKQGAIWIPSELFNRYNLKNHGAKFVSYDPEKWSNYVHDEISPFMTEVVFQGPIGHRLPFKINEYDKTNLVKRFLPHISKDKEIPYYHSMGNLYHIFEPTSSIRMPLIPYGYSQGGKIINMKKQ